MRAAQRRFATPLWTAIAVGIVAALVASAVPAVAAAKVKTVPVPLAKAKHGAKYQGAIVGYDAVHYTIDAKAGQTLKVILGGSPNAQFNVMAPGVERSLSHGTDGRHYLGRVPTDGTYKVEVFQPRDPSKPQRAVFRIAIALD
jgi:hypothetical protein